MPAVICPSCGVPVSPHARRDGYCDVCRQELPEEIPDAERLRYLAGTAEPPAAADLGPGPRFVSPAWNLVRLGLMLVAIGLVVSFLGMATAILVAVMAPQPRGAPPPPSVGGMLFLSFLLMLAGTLVVLIGKCLTCAAPPESSAKAWAVAALVSFIVSLVLAVFLGIAATQLEMRRQGAAAQRQQAPEEPDGPMMVLFLAGVAAAGMSSLFLAGSIRRIALFFKNAALAQSARRFLLLLAGLPFLVVALAFVAGALAKAAGPNALGVVTTVAAAFGVAMPAALLLWFLDLLRRGRRTIAQGFEQGMV